MSTTKLYVGNISFRASEDDLRNLFARAGEVVSVKLVRDAATGRLRGFGFIEMSTREATEEAISMFNGKKFMDRTIVVNEAKPRQKREFGGHVQRNFPARGNRL